jgi:glycosyltransferase involved in cell wall biosynthesis
MDKLNSPMITVGVTTFDRVKLLEDAITSVLNQTFKNFEIIIANDNPDRILDFDKLNIPSDSRITILNNSRNMGEIENLNWLMSQASTPYFTWLADDDLLHPRYLEVLLTELQGNSLCKVAYTNYVSGENPPSEFYSSPTTGNFETLNTQDFLLRYSDRSLSLIGCYGLFELDQLKKMGGFRSLGNGYSPGGDTLIPILLSSYTDIKYIDVPLVFFRSHAGSMSIAANELSSFTTAEFDFILHGRSSIDICSSAARKIIYVNFRKWFQDNHLTVARRRASSNIFKVSYLFLGSEYSNFMLFRSYKLGASEDIAFFLRAVKLLLLTIAKEYIFPKTRRKIKNYLNELY